MNCIGKRLEHFIAMALSLCLMVATAACSSTPAPEKSTATGTAARGSVAIFTPADGVTFSEHTPLNKWTKLTPEVQNALTATEGFQKDSISTTTSDTLDTQSRAVQDYVVGHVTSQSSSSSSASTTFKPSQETIIIAPVVTKDNAIRQYGDFVDQQVTWNESTTDSSTSSSSPSASASDSASPSPTQSPATGDDNAEAVTQRAAGERLVAALRLAKSSGMHVIVVSNPIQGFTPELFVRMATAREIGIVQAKQLVSKLALNSTSSENPKHIEVMIPVSREADDDTDTDSAGNLFAREAFAGIWSVLGKYYRDGRATSPSNTLTASSTDSSWSNVVFDARKASSAQTALASRLGKTADGQDVPVAINGILAMNDFVASGVTTELKKLGYTGSSSDINPQISISGIVGNITGKQDIQKEKAPDPKRAPTQSSEDDSNSSAAAGEKASTAWPIITGYGSYIDNIPSIVDGMQWMTVIEDRKSLATDIAHATALLNADKGIKSIPSIAQDTIEGTKVLTLSREQLIVSASNLKSILLDKDYITPAEAGL
ncbi:MAG: hypothetical protein ABF780_03175 [Bifidobacterium aquikefiri]|uniref:Periplasmic binding protein domain-containing protein n=1 Tax=Bifidobacterium aquikefiri TaxID=1653207 RepID=A0A261G5T8_9BIFI|nr:hypothetical protein [Bifidobacterium aquikefiri]OZG66789.1 hypothetical protein BAQU_0861 [Bifidobacterium aquikefiri]